MVPEILAGIAGPLVAALVSGRRMRWALRHQPERLTAVMLQAFAGKMVFFGVYVAVAVKVLQLSPMPFVIAFTSSFVALLFAEAASLSRLVNR